MSGDAQLGGIQTAQEVCADRVNIGSLAQLLESLFVAHSIQPGVQRNAVAAHAAEIAAELIGDCVQAQMILSLSVVAAEGAGCLDLPPPKRPGVEDKPAPPGRVHDGDFFIDQAASPLLSENQAAWGTEP